MSLDTHRTLYKRTSAGKVQVWYMQVEDDKFRTISGQQDGQHVTSEWTIAKPKNVGRANETSGNEQAKLEVSALYKKKLEQNGYFESIEDIDNERYFEPMLAYPFDEKRLPPDESFFLQPKYNGIRCIAKADGLWSRKGKPILNCPHIIKALKPFFAKYPNAVLDGELYNHEYKDNFNKLVSSIKKSKPTPATIAEAAEVVQYYVYDWPNMADLLPNPRDPKRGIFWRRWKSLYYEILEAGIDFSPTIVLSRTNSGYETADIAAIHQQNILEGYEGTIIRLDRPYENKRTYSLMKYKDFKDEEFEILDIQEGKGNWSGVAKIVTLKHPNGNIFGAGVKGSRDYCRKLLEDRDNIIGKLGTVVFFDLTPDGVPLFPIFHGVRDYE